MTTQRHQPRATAHRRRSHARTGRGPTTRSRPRRSRWQLPPRARAEARKCQAGLASTAGWLPRRARPLPQQCRRQPHCRPTRPGFDEKILTSAQCWESTHVFREDLDPRLGGGRGDLHGSVRNSLCLIRWPPVEGEKHREASLEVGQQRRHRNHADRRTACPDAGDRERPRVQRQVDLRRLEPPRVLRRPNTLRGLNPEQVEQVLARGPWVRSEDGAGASRGYPPLWAAIESMGPRNGRLPQTLNEWVQRRGRCWRARGRDHALEATINCPRNKNHCSTGNQQGVNKLYEKSRLTVAYSLLLGVSRLAHDYT